jgi:hypothetical protein
MNTEDPIFLRVDEECFKVVDDRVEKLRTGQLSVEGFLLLLDDNDPFILIKNTVYLLTPVEYYAIKAIGPVRDSVEAIFNTIMNMPDEAIDRLAIKDAEFIRKVKKEKATCSPCTFKKYKEAIYRIGKVYNIEVDKQSLQPAQSVAKAYPTLAKEIEQKVSFIIDNMYKMPFDRRKACIECVEKHVSQAYVLAQETYMGYPEHMNLVYAHLAEAITEAPQEANELIESLKFCLAYSKYKQLAFVPIHALLAHIKLLRYETSLDTSEATRVEAPSGMAMDLQDVNVAELDSLPAQVITKLKVECKMVIDAIESANEHNKVSTTYLFKGALACMAERVAATCTSFANMLRNRRLFFGADVATAKEAGYDFTDVMELLESKSKDSADN